MFELGKYISECMFESEVNGWQAAMCFLSPRSHESAQVESLEEVFRALETCSGLSGH